MRYLTTILFLIFSLNLFAQKIEKYYNFDWKECDMKDACYVSLTDKTDSGFVTKSYFLNTLKLAKISKFKDERCHIKDGYFYEFYPTGNLKISKRFVNGKQDGKYLWYYYNGMLKDSMNFINGERVGANLS